MTVKVVFHKFNELLIGFGGYHRLIFNPSVEFQFPTLVIPVSLNSITSTEKSERNP